MDGIFAGVPPTAQGILGLLVVVGLALFVLSLLTTHVGVRIGVSAVTIFSMIGFFFWGAYVIVPWVLGMIVIFAWSEHRSSRAQEEAQ